MLSYLTLEIRRSLRDRTFLALAVLWPAGSFLLFSTVFGSQPGSEGLTANTELMVAMATFGAFGATLIATGPRLALDRSDGWLRQVRLTPLSQSRLLAARLIAAIALTIPAICITLVVAALTRNIHLEAWEWPALVVALAAGCIPFAAIGMLVGTIADGDGASGLTMAVYLTMSALGGVWIPVSILPSTLQTVAHLLPSNRMAELGWRIASGQAPTLAAIGVLAAWLAAAAVLTAVLSRRLATRG